MKIYVDEMPKCCRDCKYLSQYGYCDLLDRKVSNPFRTALGCPLHPVAERETEVRKEVVGEIKELVFKHFNVKSLEEYEKLPLIDCLFTADTVIEILDQVERRESDVKD